MRAIFGALIISTALVSSAACHKTDSEKAGAADLADARAQYVAAAKARLAKIDAQIDTLVQRADAKSADAAARLRARRDQVAAKLDAIGAQAASGWTDLKQDVDHGVDSIQKDLDDALK